MVPRVVSLVPSSTETLLALGASVVACTRFCEQPTLEHVGGTKNPDLEAIVALAPDLVVLDREENRREDAEALEAAGLELYVSDVRTLTDALTVVDDLATRVGRPVPSIDIGPAEHDAGVSVFVPIWRRPWMSINASTYGAALLAHLGITLVTAEFPDTYPEVHLDDVRDLRPGAVLVPSEPYVFENRHVEELQRGLVSGGVMPAMMRVDGRDLFWWGIRTPAAIDRLREVVGVLRPLLHPPTD